MSSTRRRAPRFSPPSVPRPFIEIAKFIDTSTVPPRSTLSDAEATKQMASDMREGAYREGGVTEGALELLGYTPAQIKMLVPPARIMADKLAGLPR